MCHSNSEEIGVVVITVKLSEVKWSVELNDLKVSQNVPIGGFEVQLGTSVSDHHRPALEVVNPEDQRFRKIKHFAGVKISVVSESDESISLSTKSL